MCGSTSAGPRAMLTTFENTRRSWSRSRRMSFWCLAVRPWGRCYSSPAPCRSCSTQTFDPVSSGFVAIALQADFDEHGKVAIAIVRVEDPAAYLRVIASILPRELEVSQVSDVDLEATIAEVKALLAAPVEQPLLIEHDNGRERETGFRETVSRCDSEGDSKLS